MTPPNLEKILRFYYKHFDQMRDFERLSTKSSDRPPPKIKVPADEAWKQYPPPCECHECAQQFRPLADQDEPIKAYGDAFSDIEASQRIRLLCEETSSNRQYLQSRLRDYGNTILNRWKKGIAKRRDLLHKAMPKMYASKWPIPHMDRDGAEPFSKRELRNVFLLPYINFDTLSEDPMKLLSLLYYRTKYAPEDWIAFDCRQVKIGYWSGFLQIDFNRRCVVMFGRKYGSMVDWEERAAHQWDIIGFPLAQLVLEAQHTLTGLLRNVVEQLTADVSTIPSPSPSSKWQEVVNAGFKVHGTTEFWSAYANEPFSAPPVFSASRMLSIAETRRSEAEDETWLLQTDPAYFQASIARQKGVKLYEVLSGSKRTEVVANNVLKSAHCRLMMWRMIDEECKHVSEMHNAFRDSINKGDKIPSKWRLAVGALELLLVNKLLELTKDHRVLLTSPGFEQCYHYEKCSPDSMDVSLKDISEGSEFTRAWFEKDPLLWALSNLKGDPENPLLLDRSVLLSFIDDHLTRANKEERARIDQRLYNEMADIAAVDELLQTVRFHRPLFKPVNDAEAKATQASRFAWREATTGIPPFLPADLKMLGKTLEAVERARWPKGVHNQQWLTLATASRAALASFWEAGSAMWKHSLDRSNRTPEDKDQHLSAFQWYNTAEYLKQQEREKEEALAFTPKSTPTPSVRETALNLPNITVTTDETPGHVHVGESRVKRKTRPMNTAATKTNDDAHGGDDNPKRGSQEICNTTNKVAVFQESLCLFTQALCPDDGMGSKEVRWTQFTKAMTDAGFSATQGGGSAVTFEKAATGSIVFHRPHPEPKITAFILKVFGKRLARRFGWTSDTFVERTKVDA